MNKRILVIDDEDAIRKSFVLSLNRTPYEVHTAASGPEGLEMFRKNRYDLVFLDLKMPGMNGIETLQQLRTLDAGILVYIITAFHHEFFQQLAHARKQDINFELLRKPLDRQQIIAITQGILNGPVVVNNGENND